MEIDIDKLMKLLHEPSMQDPFIHKMLEMLRQNPTKDTTMIIATVVKAMAKRDEAYQQMVTEILARLPMLGFDGLG